MNSEQTNFLELPDHYWDREGDNIPEVILIDPEHGHVKFNVLVVSRRAAQFTEFFRAMRATPDELRSFADRIEDGLVIQ